MQAFLFPRTTLAKILRHVSFRKPLFRDPDHVIVKPHIIDHAANLVISHEVQRSSHCCPFVSVKETLALCDVKCICRGNVKDVAAISSNILRMKHRRLEGVLIANSKSSPKLSIESLCRKWMSSTERKSMPIAPAFGTTVHAL